MKVNIDADIAVKFLQLSLEDQAEDGLDVRYLLSCQKKRKEEIMEGIEKCYKAKLNKLWKYLPMSEDKLFRMVLDIQNTAIL